MRRGYYQGYVNHLRDIMPKNARELGKMFQDVKYEYSICLFDSVKISHGKQFCNDNCREKFIKRIKIFKEKKSMAWRGNKRKVYR